MNDHNILYRILFLCCHTDNAFTASVLGGIGIYGISLDIAAARHCYDAVVTFYEIFVVYIVHRILNFGVAVVPVFVGDNRHFFLERLFYSFGICKNVLEIGYLCFKRLIFLLEFEAIKSLKLF